MFRSFARKFLPNPFDRMLKKCAKRGGKKVLLYWNRGLGDIALGLYAMVQRIREYIPEAEVTFLTRENLIDGFSMLEGVKTIVANGWKRGEKCSFKFDPKEYDLIIEKPDPTEWVRWQLGQVIPRLKWKAVHDELHKKFELPEGYTYVGVQISAETHYGLWRNWPIERWKELFEKLRILKGYKVLLFGFGKEPLIDMEHVIDLRGKTNLFELLSIIKNRCHYLIVPDSGILSMTYYLDARFPLTLLSLWADPAHGILKQNVLSPNQELQHIPLISSRRDLREIRVEDLMRYLAPPKPLEYCPSYVEAAPTTIERTGAIILAGGQGTRLGMQGPKGSFSLHGRSLFQWICEKTPEKNFPIAIMTSPLNHEATAALFKEKKNFGREIYFFQQSLSEQGPDGNGSVFKSFIQSGLDKVFASYGIDLVMVVPVDNALADPADPWLIAHHRSKNADVTIKSVERMRPDEQAGVLIERRGHIEIIEYLDLNPRETYRYNNTGMLAMSLSFMQKMAKVDLPLHQVRKKIDGKWVWKGEKFIFDALPYAEKVEALCYPREMCYAPLKNLDQISAIESVLERRCS